MTQSNTVTVKFSNSQLSKSKSEKKWCWSNGSSSNVIGDSNDETNFLHKFLLTDTQVLKLHKACANNSSANITHQKLACLK